MTSSWVFSFSLAPSLEKAWNTWNAPEGRWTINEWWAWTRLWKPQWKVHPSSEGLQHVMSFEIWFVIFVQTQLWHVSAVMSTCFDPSVSTATYMNIYIYICVYIYWFEYILNRFTYSSPSPVSHVVCARDCSMSCGPLCSLVERVFKRLSVLQHWLPFQLAVVSLLRRTSTKKKRWNGNRLVVWNLAVWQRGLGDCCSLCVAGPALFEVTSVYGDRFETELSRCFAVPPFCIVWTSFLSHQRKNEKT